MSDNPSLLSGHACIVRLPSIFFFSRIEKWLRAKLLVGKKKDASLHKVKIHNREQQQLKASHADIIHGLWLFVWRKDVNIDT
jgi:hypothetical protein